MMFNEQDLEDMRAAQDEAMPESVEIQRRTVVADGFGGNGTAAWLTRALAVPARITPSQVMAMGGQGDRSLELEKWNVRMPYGTDLLDGDRVLWGDQTIKVEEVKSPRSYATNVSAIGEIVK